MIVRPTRGIAFKFRRILVIEDDELLASEIAHTLQSLGVQIVGPAHSIEQAMQLAQTAEFDCALLDLDLQGVRAYPVADVLLRRCVAFAFVTGYGESILERYRRIPIIDKPIDVAAIARAFAS